MGNRDQLTNEYAVQLIVDHCNKIEAVVDAVHHDFQKYEQSWWLKDILAMNILQIGERINSNLTQDFKERNLHIPWRDYVGIRNRFAHKYFTTDDEIAWETAINDIPQLKKFCVDWLIEINADIPIKQNISMVNTHLSWDD